MEKPWSTGPAKYRQERMDARLAPGRDGVYVDGKPGDMLQVTAEFDDYQATGANPKMPFVHIHYGFLMAADGRHESETGRLDAYQHVSLTYEQFERLYTLYVERRASQGGQAEDQAQEGGES